MSAEPRPKAKAKAQDPAYDYGEYTYPDGDYGEYGDYGDGDGDGDGAYDGYGKLNII